MIAFCETNACFLLYFRISLECDFRFPLSPGVVITRLSVETGSDDNSGSGGNGELKPAVGVDTQTARRLLNKESRGTSQVLLSRVAN